MTPTDDEILKRVQKGEREAYIMLFDRYYARVEGYARRQTLNAEAARDFASETFLRAYRSVEGFRIGEISYLGYLLMICRRLILTEQARFRSAPVRSLEENPEELEQLADSAVLPLEFLLSAERTAMLQTALERLPAADREIIHLAFERDLSRRDIGDIMGKPSVTAVTSHLHRAVQKLKVLIVQQGYFDAGREVERK